eukprot:766360-Hanusia_phi.AAC.4
MILILLPPACALLSSSHMSLAPRASRARRPALFSSHRCACQGCLSRIQSGGAVVNDCLLTGVNPTSAFGGLGTSGSGCYQGKYVAFFLPPPAPTLLLFVPPVASTDLHDGSRQVFIRGFLAQADGCP